MKKYLLKVKEIFHLLGYYYHCVLTKANGCLKASEENSCISKLLEDAFMTVS